MAVANPLWGAPRIHGELLKLGIHVAERTVSRLIPKRRTPPSQTWRTFLTNHVRDLVSIDLFTVPTAQLRVLFVLVVLAHHRRRVVHFNVIEHPTAAWTAQQIVDAFPGDTAPPYLLRDRDRVYGEEFRHRVKGLRITEVLTASHSPWQNPFAERLIGSARRECLDHIVALGQRHLRRILTAYFAYHHRARTHLSLDDSHPTTVHQRRSLGESEYFLLLASPQAAASNWVQQEVAFWLQHRSPGTLLINPDRRGRRVGQPRTRRGLEPDDSLAGQPRNGLHGGAPVPRPCAGPRRPRTSRSPIPRFVTLEFVGAQPGKWRVWSVGSDGRESAKSAWRAFAFTR